MANQSEKQELVNAIKQKKELSGLADKLVTDILENYLKKHKITIQNISSRDKKIIIKEVRLQLRNLAGRFQKSIKKRIDLLEKNKIEELLKTHSSTLERINFYPELKSLIEKLNIKSILDIGCGLNPIALASQDIEYYASDINEEDLKLIELFFRKNNIKGKVFFYDISSLSNNLPKADLCILFKILDIIEKRPHQLTKKILEKIDCNYFLISFATRTLSGKPMKFKRRKWLEFLLKNIRYQYKIISSNNEIFYLIQKQKSQLPIFYFV